MFYEINFGKRFSWILMLRYTMKLLLLISIWWNTLKAKFQCILVLSARKTFFTLLIYFIVTRRWKWRILHLSQKDIIFFVFIFGLGGHIETMLVYMYRAIRFTLSIRQRRIQGRAQRVRTLPIFCNQLFLLQTLWGTTNCVIWSWTDH